MSTTSSSNRLTERVSDLARECKALTRDMTPASVTDARVLRWLQTMEDCLQEAEAGAAIRLMPDLCHLDNHQLFWRGALARVAEVARWLEPATRAALEQRLAVTPHRIRRGRYELTYDCFSSRIPQWSRDLAPFVGRPDVTFLEIGSFEGYSAAWLLDHVLTHERARLVCVDVFDQKGTESLFDANITRTGAAARVTKLAALSQTVLPTLEAGRFQFIYVDGGHDQVTVLQDAVFAWRLLAPCGLLTFDDYEMHRESLLQLLPGRHHPEIAIDAFLSVFADQYDLVHKGYQVTIRKRS